MTEELLSKYELMLSRAKRLEEVYADSLVSILPLKGEEHYDWFFNRKVPLYEDRLVRHPFLTKKARLWMCKVREMELNQHFAPNFKML